MSQLLRLLFGRLPIGWLQLSHSKGRFIAAISGVAFANVLVFMQLGIMGALNNSTIAPYKMLNADIILSSEAGNTLVDSENIAKVTMFQALGEPSVVKGALLYTGNLKSTLSDGTSVSLLTFGVDPTRPDFVSPYIASSLSHLTIENTALLDAGTRGIPAKVFNDIVVGGKFSFEINGQTLSAIGLMDVGGGFLADGMLMTSDQTFLRFFPARSPSAPSHILLKVADEISHETVAQRLRAVLPANRVKVQTTQAAANADLAFMSTQRPTGIIFGFGVFMGILVGIVIVYQVLSTDVADHLREYATFKAIGYRHSFFFGIIFEQAIVLAIFGFIPGFLVSMGLYAGLVAVTGLPVEMNAGRAILVFLGTLAACTLSGAVSTRRLANADPADLF